MTTCDPDNLVFPTSATGFREGTWVLSGCSVMHDGHTIVDEYGQDLDQLSEGDCVGVMRTSGGMLHLYVNGVDQGAAATGIPSRIWAIVDMYGKCAQVTVVEDSGRVQGKKQRLITFYIISTVCVDFTFQLISVCEITETSEI